MANAGPPHVLVGLRYSATRASSPPGSCGCFLLQGAAVDAALPLRSGLSAVLEVAGDHASSVPGTSRQLSTITLLAGPRYTRRFAQRQSVFAQGIFGAVRGFDADFRRGNDATDTATAFAYAVGGAYQFRITRAVELRPIQLDLLQTNLPNGADNRQRNLRFGAGVAFSIPLGIARR
jgi:hypothetical protein